MSYDPVSKTSRTRYFVSWFGFRWHFRVEGRKTLFPFKTKKAAVDFARGYLRKRWVVDEERSELAIRDRLGRIRQKESYGDDPPEIKG